MVALEGQLNGGSSTWELFKVFWKTVGRMCHADRGQCRLSTFQAPYSFTYLDWEWSPEDLGASLAMGDFPTNHEQLLQPKTLSEDKTLMSSETALQGSTCQLLHTFLGAAPYQEAKAA